MGIGCAQRVSGSLWLHPVALGRDAGLALVYPSCTSIHRSTYLSSPEVPMPLGLLSSPRGVAVSWYEFPGYLWVSRDGSGYLGMALVSREGTRALASFPPLPLFHFPIWVLGSSLSVPRYLYVYLCITIDTYRYSYSYL